MEILPICPIRLRNTALTMKLFCITVSLMLATYASRDVGLFSPLKSAWKKHVRAWQFQNTGQMSSRRAFAGVFRKACRSVYTTVNPIGAFKQSGIYPLSLNLQLRLTRLSLKCRHLPPKQLVLLPPMMQKNKVKNGKLLPFQVQAK